MSVAESLCVSEQRGWTLTGYYIREAYLWKYRKWCLGKVSDLSILMLKYVIKERETR